MIHNALSLGLDLESGMKSEATVLLPYPSRPLGQFGWRSPLRVEIRCRYEKKLSPLQRVGQGEDSLQEGTGHVRKA
jgi:hypothetical protein